MNHGTRSHGIMCENAKEKWNDAILKIEKHKNYLIKSTDSTFFIPVSFADLSDCQLVQLPDAVYHLMRNTELKTCDLSSNVIKRIPPKFAVNFSLITGTYKTYASCDNLSHLFNFVFIFVTDLNLSNNQINKLPDELADLTLLLRLDISHNLFLTLPRVVFKMPKLRQLKANNNAIIGELMITVTNCWLSIVIFSLVMRLHFSSLTLSVF